MSTTDVPAEDASQSADDKVETRSAANEWVETALTLLFTVAAVLFVSFIAVVTGIV
jgi:hypothetical protein